ncbi:MAG: hypothetical protein ACE5HH_01120 [Candidatus Hydrothermarchaeales archaeon]
MSKRLRYTVWALIVVVALLFFYRVGQSAYRDNKALTIDSNNLTNLPTSTPRPQIFRLIKEALKRRPRPTVPPEDVS